MSDSNNISKDYKFDFDISQEDPGMPEVLVPLLPENNMISIVGYGNSEKSAGHRYWVGTYEYRDAPGEFIQYHAEAKGVFERSYHPFIQRYTENVSLCAENMMAYIEPYCPITYEVRQDQLHMSLKWGGRGGYTETTDFIAYNDGESYSYHDGGGGSGCKWVLYPAEENLRYKEENLSHDIRLNKIWLPDCKGWWTEDDHLYLADPWGIPGIFNFYHHKWEQRDYESETERWSIGIKCPEKREQEGL